MTTSKPSTDTLYAQMTKHSRLLPATSPWLYAVGDFVRLASGEFVQIIDGFLHVRRGVGSREKSYAPAGSTVLIVRAVSEGSNL